MAQQPIFNRRSIAEFLALPWETFAGDHVYVVVGEIEGINAETGWSESLCTKCAHTLVINEGGYYCNQCAVPCQDPLIRYKISFAVRDNTGKANFDLYSPEADQLFNQSAKQLMSHVHLQSNQIPDEIMNMVGRYFAIDIKVPQLGGQGHPIVRITELALGAEGRKMFGKKRKRKMALGANTAAATQPPRIVSVTKNPATIRNPAKEQSGKQRKITTG